MSDVPSVGLSLEVNLINSSVNSIKSLLQSRRMSRNSNNTSARSLDLVSGLDGSSVEDDGI